MSISKCSDVCHYSVLFIRLKDRSGWDFDSIDSYAHNNEISRAVNNSKMVDFGLIFNVRIRSMLKSIMYYALICLVGNILFVSYGVISTLITTFIFHCGYIIAKIDASSNFFYRFTIFETTSLYLNPYQFFFFSD